MYGFHKVNKTRARSFSNGSPTPRDQTWEFSHPQFQRHRADLVSQIKRKPHGTESLSRDMGTLESSITVLQSTNSKLIHQMGMMQQTLGQVVGELQHSRKVQQVQQGVLRAVLSEAKLDVSKYGKLPLRCQVVTDVVLFS
jgi:LPS O-antigen subunit length determinant protein (WzzB/FepE family)